MMNLQTHLGRTDILALESLTVQEHGVSLHFLVLTAL